MKKINVLFCFLLVSIASFAQESDKKEMPEKKNAVKLNLSSLAFSNIALQYERAIHPKFSAALQLRMMPGRTMPGAGQVGDDPFFTSAKLSSFTVTPEFRYYVRKAMKGFYLAPYARIRSINFKSMLSVDAGATQPILDLNGKFTSFGGGLMIGSHFHLSKSLSLDWFIIGGQFMSTKMNFSASGFNFTNAERDALQSEINTLLADTDRFVKNSTVTVTNTSMITKGSFGLPGIRGMGINIGYRF